MEKMKGEAGKRDIMLIIPYYASSRVHTDLLSESSDTMRRDPFHLMCLIPLFP